MSGIRGYRVLLIACRVGFFLHVYSSWVAVSLMMDAGIRVVSNAGGVNPQACVAALLQAARDQGLELSVATVTGDDFTDRVCISYSLHSYSLLVYTSILILLYRRWRRFRC